MTPTTNFTGMDVAAVIPVRDRPSLLARAIDSILQQTHPVREIIVVDDCSTDDTPKVAESYAASGHPVKLLRQPARAGAPAARNRGASAAKTALLAFLDSDDEWAPDKIGQQIQAMNSKVGLAGSFTRIKRLHADGSTSESQWFGLTRPADLYRGNVLGSCSAALVRLDFFLEVGGFDESLKSCQDWDLWLRMSERSPFYCCPEPSTIYHFDANDRISRNPDNVISGHEHIFSKIQSIVEDPRDIPRLHLDHQLYLASTYTHSLGMPLLALSTLLNAAPQALIQGKVGELAAIALSTAKTMLKERRLAP